MAGSRELKVVILADSSKAERAFKKLEQAGDGLGTKMGGLGNRLGGLATSFAKVGAAAVAAGAAAGAAFGAKAINAASDLNEQLSKVGVVFGESASQVTAFANQMAKDFGLPKAQILEAAGAIGLVGKASGLSQGDAAKLGTNMAKLAADASSFFNVPLEEALTSIRSGLVGEAEPLRRFGVLLSEDAVKAEALALGIAKGAVDAGKAKAATQNLAIAQRKLNETTAEFGADSTQAQKAALALTKAENGLKTATGKAKVELTEQQKVQARVSLITKGMTDATGDLTRTQDSFANRLRELKGRAENFAAEVGMRLLPLASKAFDLFERWAPSVQRVGERLGRQLAPAVEKVAEFIRTKVVPALQQFAGYITETVLPALKGAWEFLRDRFVSAFSRVSEALADNREGLKKLADFLTTRVIPAIVAVAGVLVETLGLALTGAIIIIGHVTDAWDLVVGAMRSVVSFIADKILAAFEWVARGAAAAFGWVPGLGPKLEQAAADIEAFRNKVNASLDGIKDKEVKVKLNVIGAVPGQPGNVFASLPGAMGPPTIVPQFESVPAGAMGPPTINNNVTVNARTQATGTEIAREIGWARRGWN